MTLESTCEALLSSTYHATVHCFSLMFLFATHLSYLFSIYYSAFKVCVYKLYHCSADSIHPYIVLSTFKYNIFLPCSYLTYCLYSQFMLHMMSTKFPRSFRITFLSAGISACKYASGMSKLAMLRSLYASITRVVKSYSRDTVGDATLSSFTKYLFCLLPSAHVLLLIVPSRFCFMIFTALSDSAFTSADKISGFIAVTIFSLAQGLILIF